MPERRASDPNIWGPGFNAHCDFLFSRSKACDAIIANFGYFVKNSIATLICNKK